MLLHRSAVCSLVILAGSLVAIPALAGSALAGEPGTVGIVDLPQAVQLALQGHPRIAAQRASLAAAEESVKALDALRAVAALVTPELPTRRRQACLGVTAAAAALDEAERETVYAVTRSYYAVVFAREQERVAKRVVERLTTLRDAAQRQLDAGARDVSSADVARAGVYVRLAQTRRIEATHGVKRAAAALREAVGLPPCSSVDVADTPLAAPAAHPVLKEVVAAALTRRGSLIQTGVFAEVAGLEVTAQGASHQKRLETFASGSDIHATVVPQAEHGTEYRPGGISPEMPSVLAGSRPERVRHAQLLRDRAGAVAEGTRSLVALEAEDAFLRWEQAALQAAETKGAADDAEKAAEDLARDFTGGAKVRVEDVTTARVLASQTRSLSNEFVFRQIVALADLERITGGGFCAGLTGARPAAGTTTPFLIRPAPRCRRSPPRVRPNWFRLHRFVSTTLDRSRQDGSQSCRGQILSADTSATLLLLPADRPPGWHSLCGITPDFAALELGCCSTDNWGFVMEWIGITGRSVIVVLALAGAAFVGSGNRSAGQSKPDVLKVGASGTFAPEKGEKGKGAVETLQKFIRDETGLKNDITRPADWRELAEKMAKGEFHVGVFQGFEFVWAKEKYPDLKPLALAVNVHTYPVAHVVTKANNSATGVGELKGKSVTISVENQPDLRLYLGHEAKDGGKLETFFSKVTTDQNAEDALDDVVDGVVAAAVADQAALEAFRRRKPARFKQLKQVAQSAPLPPVVIAMYGDNLDQPTRDRFVQGLIGANKKEAGQTMLTLFKLTGFVVPPSDFEKVMTETRKTYPPPAK